MSAYYLTPNASGEAMRLLERAAERLQDFMAEYHGDINDPLATEIYRFVRDCREPTKTKG